VRRFLPGSLASSAVWSVYMLLIGMVLGPIVGGNPFLSLAAGVVMAVLTAGGFALVQRVRAARRPVLSAAPTVPNPVAPAPVSTSPVGAGTEAVPAFVTP
jgi:membrane-associated protein